MIGEASAAVRKAIQEAEDDLRRKLRYRTLMNRCDELLDALERWNLVSVKEVNSILLAMIQAFQLDAGTDHQVDVSTVQAALDSLLEVQQEIMGWKPNPVYTELTEDVVVVP